MARVAAQPVRSAELVEVLVAPARIEIVEALRLHGPASVAEIAATIDRPADTLYRHLEALKAAGFVVDAGFRRSGRHTEQLFDVVAEDFPLEFDEGRAARAEEHRAIVAMADSFLKAAGKAVRESATARELQYGVADRNLSLNYELGWLTPERFDEVRALIRRIKAIMDEGKRTREGRLYLTLAIATPVTRKRHAKPLVADESAPPARARRATRGAAKPKHAKRAAR